MKKWMDHIRISVLLLVALLSFSASAKDSGTAVLTKAEGSNNVTVSLDLAEGGTENITSIHFSMYISVESGERMDEPTFQFAEGIPSAVKDARVYWDEASSDYLIDIILSGTEDQLILDGKGDALIGTLVIPDGDYYAEVGLVRVDAESEEDSVPVLQYADSAGLTAMSVHMTNVVPVMIGQKPEEPAPEETPQPTAAPEETPEPTATPEETPEPTATPEETPAPTATPEEPPEPTATPEETPEPTPTPGEVPPAPTPGTSPEPSETRPEAPALTVLTRPGSEKVSFKWNAVSGVDGYEICQRDQASAVYERTATLAGSDRLSFLKNFQRGEKYAFRIRSFRKESDGTVLYSAYSPAVFVSLSAFDPARRVNMKASTTHFGTSVYFTWDRTEGADGYEIFRYDWKYKKYVRLAILGKGSQRSYVSNAAFANGGEYRFAMRAYALDADGKTRIYGAYSEPVTVRIAPARVGAIAGRSYVQGKANVYWRRVYNAQGYCVYRSTSETNGFRKVATITDGNTLRFTDQNLSSGKTYYYRVRAYVLNTQGHVLYGSTSGACRVAVR